MAKTAKRKRKPPKPMNLPNPLQVDEGEFTDVIGKMVNTEPEPLQKIVARHKRKNPETDPRYLPVFDFGNPRKR